MRRIDHLGFAVEDLQESLSLWRDRFGLRPGPEETVPGQGVRTVFLPVGDTRLELLQPSGPDTPVGRFLRRRGPGFHHICFLVEDLEATLASLSRTGARLIDAEPRPGAEASRVAFVHPSSAGGVLVELKEADGGAGTRGGSPR